MNRRRPLLGLDPVLLTTLQRRYTGAHAPNNPGLAAKRKRNDDRTHRSQALASVAGSLTEQGRTLIAACAVVFCRPSAVPIAEPSTGRCWPRSFSSG